MEIRRAQLADATRISYLIQKNTEKVLENNYSQEQKEVWKRANTVGSIKQKIKEATIFCAFQNGQMAGTIGLQGNEVFGLYVSYAKRGLGIGGKLMTHLEGYAKDKNLEELSLTSTPSALLFYQSKGFKAIEKCTVTIMGVPFEETLMKKTLKPKTIIDTSNAEHYVWGDQCLAWHFLKNESLSVIKELMPSGTKEMMHFHSNAQQFFYILNGVAHFEVDGQTYEVNQNQGLHIYPGQKHMISNMSESDLEFLIISQPKAHGDRIDINH
ncbi:MAG: GNAT family N-acetyltransferase [Bacteroidota bacterium]